MPTYEVEPESEDILSLLSEALDDRREEPRSWSSLSYENGDGTTWYRDPDFLPAVEEEYLREQTSLERRSIAATADEALSSRIRSLEQSANLNPGTYHASQWLDEARDLRGLTKIPAALAMVQSWPLGTIIEPAELRRLQMLLRKAPKECLKSDWKVETEGLSAFFIYGRVFICIDGHPKRMQVYDYRESLQDALHEEIVEALLETVPGSEHITRHVIAKDLGYHPVGSATSEWTFHWNDRWHILSVLHEPTGLHLRYDGHRAFLQYQLGRLGVGLNQAQICFQQATGLHDDLRPRWIYRDEVECRVLANFTLRQAGIETEGDDKFPEEALRCQDQFAKELAPYFEDAVEVSQPSRWNLLGVSEEE